MGAGGPESGFRRLPAFRRALLVADVARLCGDWPATWTPPPEGFDEPQIVIGVRHHLEAIDAVARRLTSRAASCSFLDDAPSEVHFLLATDVDEMPARLRAIIARAYARADAVAWGLEQSFADARERGWKGRPVGRPAATIARTWFIMRLAVVWSLMTGESPAFEGGDERRPRPDPAGPRKRGSAWHDLVNASLRITQAYGAASTDSVLRAVTDLNRPGTRRKTSKLQPDNLLEEQRRAFDRLPDNFFGEQIRELAAAANGRRHEPWARYIPDRPLSCYGDLPEVGIEIDACLGDAPINREEAYRPSSTQYEGLSD